MINLSNLDENKFIDVADYWGDKMPMLLMEECGELIQAVSKYEREYSKKRRDNLLEEIRDMYISLEAIKYLYSIDDNELNDLIEKKLNKKYWR